MMHRSRLHRAERGFTLIELSITMVITVVVTTVVLVYAIDYWGASTSLQNDSLSFVDRNNAGDRLRDSLNTASGLIMQNSIPDPNTLSADAGNGTGQYWTIIHAIPGNKPIGASGTITPLIYFQSPATTSAKSIILNGANPYTNEFVMYLNGSTKQMLMRSLANVSASGNATVTSCQASIASASCPQDRLIASNISSVDVRYFSRTGNLIDYTSITDPLTGNYIGPDFTAVEVVEFTIHEFTNATIHGAQDTINQTIVRVALRNG